MKHRHLAACKRPRSMWLPLAVATAMLSVSACDNSSSGSSNSATGTIAADGRSGAVNDVNAKSTGFAINSGKFTSLTRVATPSGAASGVQYPNGFFSFVITGLTTGQTVTVTVSLPKGSAPTNVTKCTSATSCAVFPGATIAGDVVTLTLTDGGAGDADGAANGSITDPFAPTKSASANGTGGSGGTGGTAGTGGSGGTGGSAGSGGTGGSAGSGGTGGTAGSGGTGGSGGSAGTGGSGGTGGAGGCPETGQFACLSGAGAGGTAGYSGEPLYKYQWAHKKSTSHFAGLNNINFTKDDGLDLNVEDVHKAGIKGAGVNVLVLDDGVDIRNEDLAPNVNLTMVRNFDFAADASADSEFGKFMDSDAAAMKAKDDPTPIVKGSPDANRTAAHGTNVAGIILAAQNSKGVIGIAPKATLGGASFLATANSNITEAYGGGAWAQNAHVINASFGSNPATPPSYDVTDNTALKGLVNLRGGKGTLFVKAVGNEFGGIGQRFCEVGTEGGAQPMKDKLSCESIFNDTEFFEPMVIGAGAINANGQKSSYSNAGGLVWVMGTGGEFGGNGDYGQGKGGQNNDGTDGPTMFSTDLRTLMRGYANTFDANTDPDKAATTAFLRGTSGNPLENPNGDYSYMNGTSAATPSVTGVVALILSANPNLGWRDVREILAATARPIEQTSPYPVRVGTDKQFDLAAREFTTTAASGLADAATTAQLEYGWQATGGTSNGKTLQHSTWYGFGVADANAAVTMAKSYTGLLRTTITATDYPAFSALTLTNPVPGQVKKIGQFNPPSDVQVDQVQLRVTGGICIGSVGFAIKAPNGTVAMLSTPLNSYYSNRGGDGETKGGVGAVDKYTLGSYAFFGRPVTTSDVFEVFAISTTPTDGTDDISKCTAGATALSAEYRILPRVTELKTSN